MNGSPSSVLTLGLGSWGSVGLLITLGYGVSQAVTAPAEQTWTAGAIDRTWTAGAISRTWVAPAIDRTWIAGDPE